MAEKACVRSSRMCRASLTDSQREVFLDQREVAVVVQQLTQSEVDQLGVVRGALQGSSRY